MFTRMVFRGTILELHRFSVCKFVSIILFLWFLRRAIPYAYSETCQTSKAERFEKMVNG